MTPTAQLNGRVFQYDWSWKTHRIAIAYETRGQGLPVLLMPALSTVSTRHELAAIAQGLCPHFQVTVVDWPGFGESDRPKLDYSPSLYHQFLQDFVRDQFSTPVAIMATGHSAGYALSLSAQDCSALVLVAPTWKGPLTAMGLAKPMRDGLQRLVQSPVVGQGLYGLNTQPAFLRLMYRRHVMVDEERLTSAFIAMRHQNTQKKGARYAPAAFVTGNLDPISTRDQALSLVQDFNAPIMVMLGEQAPPKSKAEMEAIAACPEVTSIRLPGSLGMAEELGRDIAPIIRSFLVSLQ